MPDIIIVEDNKEIGTLLCDFLRRENYTVSLADTGKRSLSFKKRKRRSYFHWHMTLKLRFQRFGCTTKHYLKISMIHRKKEHRYMQELTKT